MDPGATDVMAVIDQSLDTILKTSRKMRECLEVSGDHSLPPDAQSLITDSCRKLVLTKNKLQNLVEAFTETKSQLANTATDTVESDEEEGAVPNPEDGSQEVDVPDGKQLMAENMAARPDSSDQVINSSLFLKEVNQILLGPDAPSASSSQSTQSSPSRNRRRRTGDLEVLQSEPVIPIDPFTKREIEFAVKNKKCGHIYDRSALTAFLTQSRNPRCPNVGCVNRTQLTQNSVDVDTETNALIERLKHGD